MNTILVSTKSPINYPSMGSLYLIDSMQKQGINTTHLDSSIKFSELEKKINETESKVVNMSVITSPEIVNSVELSKQIKKNYPDIKVLWGGIHPTINTEQCISENYIDNVITGNGEETLPRALIDIENGRNIKKVIESPRITNLDKYSPAWDSVNRMSDFLFPETHSVKDGADKMKNIFYYLDTSRGCPHKCSFCEIGSNGKWISHSSDTVKNQIEYINDRITLEGNKMDGIGFWDDMFWSNKERAYSILDTLKTKNLGYLIEARADQLMKNNSELEKQLLETGCLQVFIGAESGNQKTLDYLNKKTNVTDYYKLMEDANNNKLSTRFSMIVGFPYETDKSVNDTLDLVQKMSSDDNPYCSVSGPKLYTPYPGTLEFDRSVERGYKIPKNTEGWSEIHRRSDGYLDKFPWLRENLTDKTLNRMEKEMR